MGNRMRKATKRTSPLYRLLATCTLFFYFFSFLTFRAVTLYADQPATVDHDEAQQMNPNSNIQIDPATGFPVQATGHYTPAETNPLLGESIFMSPLECIKKYGVNFCQCGKTEEGAQYCYYKRPSVSFYTSMASCEAVWGVGQCICDNQTCRLNDAQGTAQPLACNGKIYVFSGTKVECRKAGIMSAGTNCCKVHGAEDSACSFTNMSNEIGMGQIAMTALSLGNDLIQLAGYDSLQKQLGNKIASAIAQEWLKNGTTAGCLGDLTSLIGGENASSLLSAFDTAMSAYNSAAAAGGSAAEMGVLDTAQNEALDGATGAAAEAIGTVVTVAGWVYFAYQVYNIYSQLSDCTAGEMALGCKIAKGVCHEVGSRCKSEAFGSCLQKMGVYCCYNSKLGRIINEQGLSQVGRTFGTGDIPDCRGFTLDEFAQINLSNIDFTEYQDDLLRELSPSAQKKYLDAINNLKNTFNLEFGNPSN